MRLCITERFVTYFKSQHCWLNTCQPGTNAWGLGFMLPSIRNVKECIDIANPFQKNVLIITLDKAAIIKTAKSFADFMQKCYSII